MSEMISDEEALGFFREEWPKVGNAERHDLSYLTILDRLENERAILFYVLDKRYWDDLRIIRFSGCPITIGRSFVLHYFDKRESIFKELDEAAHRYFTKEEIDEFFVPERTDYDVLVKLRRFKVVRQDFLQQILHSAPFDGYTMWEAGGYDGVIADPYRDPTKVPTRFDNSRYFVRPAKLSELSKSEEEHLLALLEGRLSELHITHWREGDKIAIDRYYPGRIQSP